MTRTHAGTAVPAGAIACQNGWMHRFSAKLTCNVIGMINGGGEVDCGTGPNHSFRMSPSLVRVKN